MYVQGRLASVGESELVEIARRVVNEFGDEDLDEMLAAIGPRGVDGEAKNLIFAANGPKPRIVLRDAINNVIDIVENAEFCLVYDRPLEGDGLRWEELVGWWAAKTRSQADYRTNARSLYDRLHASLDSDPERRLFRAYAQRYARGGKGAPALIPQVYLHYDPYTRRELAVAEGDELRRQRMDFLLLLPGRVRVVIEVDGRQHYAESEKASPRLYSEMIAEDRRIRLAGYEVFRFGGYELTQRDADQLVTSFFDELLHRFDSKANTL